MERINPIGRNNNAYAIIIPNKISAGRQLYFCSCFRSTSLLSATLGFEKTKINPSKIPTIEIILGNELGQIGLSFAKGGKLASMTKKAVYPYIIDTVKKNNARERSKDTTLTSYNKKALRKDLGQYT